MDMSTTLIHKYHTLKPKKSTSRPSSKDIFPPSPPIPTQAQPYTTFIIDLVSAFNSLSTPSASSTTSPTLHTSFLGLDHEALVDTKEKKKVVKALQLANPAQVNEIISLLKAMPDPSKTAAGAGIGKKEGRKAHSRDSSQQSVLSLLIQDKPKTKDANAAGSAKKQKRVDEDEKLGEDWDKVEKTWAWETQKSNDQLTGVVDPESCKSAIATAGSWLFSSGAPSPEAPAVKPAKAEAQQKTVKPKPSKISTTATNDATRSTSFGSLFASTPTTATISDTKTKSKPPVDSSSPHNKNNKHTASTKRTASSTSLSTGEQIAKAAATLLATAAVASPKELPPSTQQKQIQRQSSMPNIKTATLKRLLTTTKASTTATSDSSSTPTKSKSSSITDLTAPSAPSYISATITSLTRQWIAFQSSPPPTHMMSAYTYWWGYEIYVPHKCMDNIERVSNTSQIFFGFLSTTVSAIPGLASLVPIAQIISAWVGYQWAVIKTQDTGKGVVISATWVLPVALASRPWDHCGNEDDAFPTESSLLPSPKKSLKSKLGLA
ncbi:hypothetical protein KI688_011161 [Linnemannia hyalina]|uniref:Uncharacterized protein n=1 Tax=Linnemannia hyalina TaxID=64524 RepID=A0A9P7XYE8_9FUNG|nr:hypothetical protein KI688_011161 [Linnemannia hyalina]